MPEVRVDPLTGLLDSNRTDVQDFGIELVRKYLPALPLADLIDRLVEHPHPNMRRFALDLVTQHLPPDTDALARLKEFCRAALFDLWPQRKVKSGLIDFPARREGQDVFLCWRIGEERVAHWHGMEAGFAGRRAL